MTDQMSLGCAGLSTCLFDGPRHPGGQGIKRQPGWRIDADHLVVAGSTQAPMQQEHGTAVLEQAVQQDDRRPAGPAVQGEGREPPQRSQQQGQEQAGELAQQQTCSEAVAAWCATAGSALTRSYHATAKLISHRQTEQDGGKNQDRSQQGEKDGNTANTMAMPRS